jgi:hypothetical protein
MKPKKRCIEEKVVLARRIYDLVFENTESFEADNIGIALAYLMGAILNGDEVDVEIPPSKDEPTGALWLLLCEHLDENDDVFDYFNRIEMVGGQEVKDEIEN